MSPVCRISLQNIILSLRRLVFDQKCPFHPVSKSRAEGGLRFTDGVGGGGLKFLCLILDLLTEEM